MNIFSSILITIAVGFCYFVYNYYMLAFFDILTGKTTTLKTRIVVTLINYSAFFVLSLINFYLFINWSIIGFICIVEMYFIYRSGRLLSVTLGLQGALMGLAVNSLIRCCSAIFSGLPLAAFDAYGQQGLNLSRYPIAVGFLVTGLIFLSLCHMYKNWSPSDPKYRNLNIKFLFAMGLSFFLYMDLNLLIYLAEGRETIIKIWGIKSSLCVLIGTLICYRHILILSRFSDYEDKTNNVREELQSHKIVNERLESAAYYDILTSCKNRTAAIRDLEELYQNKTPFVLCYLDLDKLKIVNDYFGHDSGDKYLVTVGYVLRETLGENAQIYRYGGDEFLVIELHSDKNRLNKKMEEVTKALEEHSHSTEHPYMLSISYGITSSDQASTVEELLKLADSRMYRQKEENRDKIHTENYKN